MAAQLEGFNSIIKNQLSFNKMIETQVAQLASSYPNVNTGKLPGQPELTPKETVSAVTTRGGKTTQERHEEASWATWFSIILLKLSWFLNNRIKSH